METALDKTAKPELNRYRHSAPSPISSSQSHLLAPTAHLLCRAPFIAFSLREEACDSSCGASYVCGYTHFGIHSPTSGLPFLTLELTTLRLAAVRSSPPPPSACAVRRSPRPPAGTAATPPSASRSSSSLRRLARARGTLAPSPSPSPSSSSCALRPPSASKRAAFKAATLC